MAAGYISLNCASCGAKLDVYEDMERFSCSYCGTELIVQRRGGTVALKAVTEAIRKVQIGTDKTAAELAIPRLEIELEEARRKTNKAFGDEFSDANVGCGCGALLAVIGSVQLIAQEWGAGIAVSIAAALAITYGSLARKRQESAKLKALRDQVRQLENLIAEKKRVANG